jgi:pimeloyl-ACP methyl ester carboxylesterase
VSDVKDTGASDASYIEVHGTKLEVVRRGQGRPILFLHPAIGLDPHAPVIDMLAQGGDVIAPSHPGFGRSSKAKHVTTVDDISYIYLDLIEQLDLRDIVLVGVSLGAWIAAAISTKTCERIGHVILADPLGIKLGGADEADIANMFMLPPADFDRLAFADVANAPGNWADKDPEEARIAARNREMTVQVGWLPYMYDPKLRSRLHRISCPTLLLWGEQDRVVSKSYVRGFGEALPNASLKTIPDAGHYPHIEKPRTFSSAVLSFVSDSAIQTSTVETLLP